MDRVGIGPTEWDRLHAEDRARTEVWPEQQAAGGPPPHLGDQQQLTAAEVGLYPRGLYPSAAFETQLLNLKSSIKWSSCTAKWAQP